MPNQSASSAVTLPERPNSRMSARPITNGGVMIGSTARTRNIPAKRRPVRRHQREGKSKCGRAKADRNRKDQGVPRNAAAQRRTKAIESPDGAVEKFVCELRQREGALLITKGAGEDDDDREKDKIGRESDHDPDGPDDESIAAAPAASGQPLAQQHQESCRYEAGAQPHARLARPFCTEEIGENGPVPASQADCETLDRIKYKSSNTRANQHAARLLAPRPDQWPSCDHERRRDQREPPRSVGPGEPERRTRPLRRIADEPVVPPRVSKQMPRQEREADPAQHKPYTGGRGHLVSRRLDEWPYFGEFRTSLSHLVSRRLRSADEPYLTKLKSISLISPSFSACGGTGGFLFEGTWNALDRAPNAWASGVSAQSYHFFALSALRPPLMIDIDPIS